MGVALALQVGVNYANDYSDGVRGTDAGRVGPARLVASGAAAPGQVRLAAFAAFGAAARKRALQYSWDAVLAELVDGIRPGERRLAGLRRPHHLLVVQDPLPAGAVAASAVPAHVEPLPPPAE